MWHLGIRGNLSTWLQSYLTNRCQSVRVLGCQSARTSVSSGVPQGSHIGPLLFIGYINDIIECAKNSSILLYADDVKIFRSDCTPMDASALQRDLNSLVSWASSNGLSSNLKKCNVMSFSRLNNKFMYNYVLRGVSIDRADSVSDLGIIFSPTLSFAEHAQVTISKSFKLLGFISRVTSDFRSPDSILYLYKSLILPHLTYGSIIWSPQLQYLSKSLERVQHRLVRLLALKSGCPMPYVDHDYSPLMSRFNLLPLQLMHKYHDLLFTYKVLHGYTLSREVSDLFTMRTPQYQLRVFNVILEDTHGSSFTFNSPVPRLRRSWNSLPVTTQHATSIRRFKNVVLGSLYTSYNESLV